MKKLTSLLLSLAMLSSLALPAQAAQGGSLVRAVPMAAPAADPVPETTPAPTPEAVPAAASAGEEGYSDTIGHYAAGVIDVWSGYGVLKGYEDGTFRPDGTITRAELAVVLDRVMGYQEAAENTFADLPAEAWYTECLLRMAEQGIFTGGEDKKMNPNAPITRQETFAAMARALALKESGEPTGFADDGTISDWAKGYVSAMKKAGYIQGDQEGNIRAADPITRAEVVSILNKMVSAFVTTDGVYSKDCKGNLFVKAKDVTLKDMTIDGDLIITDGVGDGDVRLDNVEVKGDVVLRGCGENSFHILPGSETGTIVVNKTFGGAVRVANDAAAALSFVKVEAADGGVILEGGIQNVTIVSDASVTIYKGKVKNLTVDAANAKVSVGKEAKADKVELTDTADAAELAVEGTVTNLVTNAAATVTNNGKVSSVKAQASGLVIEGKKPARVTAAAGVKAPVDTNGKRIVSSAAVSYSSSSSSSSTPPPASSATPIPTDTPSPAPTDTPSPAPTGTPSPAPTDTSSPVPTATPTPTPTVTPTPPPTTCNHVWSDRAYTYSANCTSRTANRVCTLCGSLETAAPTAETGLWHDWVDDNDAQAATCEGYGHATNQTCRRCGAKRMGAVIQPLGHDYQWEQAGIWWLQRCSVCQGIKEREQQCDGNNEHVWEEIETYTSCTSKTGKRVCHVCGTEDTSYISGGVIHDGAWHIPVSNNDQVDPTCTTDGLEATWTCQRCGLKYPDQLGGSASGPAKRETIPATGHKGDWTVVLPATASSMGVKSRTCTACGIVEYEFIPAAPGV